MGRKDTAITNSEKNKGRPTSFAAAMMVSVRLLSHPPSPGAPGRAPSRGGFCSNRLCAFSTITIAASTIAPMAMAMPPSDMMLEVILRYAIGMKANSTATGRIRIATSALLKWKRNTSATKLTMTLSSSNFSRSTAMARWIRSERSYVGMIWTPDGSDGFNSSNFAFTRSMTSSAFSPARMMTIPATVCPLPSSSAMPRRSSGPSWTRATSFTRIGVPRWLVPTTTCSMSWIDRKYCDPRIIYSVPVISSTRPLTSALLFRTASMTVLIGNR